MKLPFSFIHSQFDLIIEWKMSISLSLMRAQQKKNTERERGTFLSMGKCEKQIRMNGSFYFENSSNITNAFHCFDSCVYSIVLLLLFLLLQIVVIRCILFGCTFTGEWLLPEEWLCSGLCAMSNRQSLVRIVFWFSSSEPSWYCIWLNELHT